MHGPQIPEERKLSERRAAKSLKRETVISEHFTVPLTLPLTKIETTITTTILGLSGYMKINIE